MSQLIQWNMLSLDGYFEGARSWDVEWFHPYFNEELEKFSIEQLRAQLDLCAAAGTEPVRAEKPAKPALDGQVLDRIRHLSPAGKPDLLARVTNLYVSSSSELVEALRSAARAGDVAALGAAAHGLRSSSANVGAMGLAATCGDLEHAAREGKIDLATNLVHQVISEHREVLRALGTAHEGSTTASGLASQAGR